MVLPMSLVMFRAGVTVVLLTKLLWPMVLLVATLYLLLSLAAW
jgi:thiamine transporter ThiT